MRFEIKRLKSKLEDLSLDGLARVPLLCHLFSTRVAKLRLLVSLSVLVLLLFIYVLIILITEAGGTRGQEYKVKLLSLEAGVYQRGILRSSAVTPTKVNVTGNIQEIVEDGSSVKKGDTLFVMDSDQRELELNDKRIKLERDQLHLKSLEALFAFTEFKESQQLQLLKAKWEHARLNQEYELGIPHADELRKIEINKHLAEFDLEDAESDLERNRRLLEKGFISESALEPYRLKVNTARIFLEEIKLEIKIKQKGISEERRVELRRALERADSNLKRHQNRMERSLALIRADIETTKHRIESILFEVEVIETELAHVATKAETDGIFQIREYSDWRLGGRRIKFKPGVERYARNVIGEIIDPSKMKIDLAINEADLTDLKQGQRVKINIPAIPHKSFRGELTLLGSIGRDRNQIDPTAKGEGFSGVVAYNATVHFDGDRDIFHPGMSALVSIITQPEAERLVIPRAALLFKDERVFVYLKSIFGVKRTEISGRVFNENYFEVTSGVSVGDVVLINYKEKS